MSEKRLLPFAELLAELEQLCQQRRTGTLLIFAASNRFAQFKLSEGEVVSLMYQNVRGTDALPLIREIRTGWSVFTNGAVSSSTDPRFSTADIIEALSSQNGNEVACRVEPPSPAINALTEEAKSMVKQTLARFIGPMAEVIFEEHLHKARDLESFIAALAGEIPDPERAFQYRSDVERRLSIG